MFYLPTDNYSSLQNPKILYTSNIKNTSEEGTYCSYLLIFCSKIFESYGYSLCNDVCGNIKTPIY